MSSPLLARLTYDTHPFVFDDAGWKEDQHPRDPDGKFTAGAGGSGGGGQGETPKPTEPYKVTNHIKAVLKAAGFSPAKDPKNKFLVAFKHPNGSQVVIHPPSPGKKFSSAWEMMDNGSSKKGEGINGITKLVQGTVKEAEKKKEDASNMKPEIKKMHEAAVNSGFFTSSSGAGYTQMDNKDGMKIMLDNDNGQWSLYDPNGFSIDGGSTESGLKAALSTLSTPDPGDLDHLKMNGYKLNSKVDADGLVEVQTPDGNIVAYNTKTGNWAAQNSTMAGKGMSELFQQYGTEEAEYEEETAEASTLSDVPSHLQTALESKGFKFDPEQGKIDGDLHFTGGLGDDVHVAFDPEFGDWTMMYKDGTSETGNGATILADKLNATPKPAAPKPSIPPMLAIEAAGTMAKHGFAPVENKNGVAKMNKASSGADLEFNPATGDWLLKTPGYNTKKGNGVDKLEKLLSGEKAYEENGKWSWENTTESTIVPPSPPTAAELAAQKAAKEEQAKKAAEQAQKKAAEQAKKDAEYKAQFEKVKKQDETLKTLIAAAPTPTTSERKGIKGYTGSAYDPMNSALRAGKPLTGSYAEYQKGLDSYLNDKATIPVDCTVYRKISNDYAKFLQSVAAVPGASFIDRGFISTATHDSSWSGSMQMVISLKAGAKGAAVDHMSSNQGEKEVILPRNTMFKVTKVDKAVPGFTHGVIHVEIDQTYVGKEL